MELNLIARDGSVSSKVDVSEAIFARAYNEALVHQVVVAYMSNARLGSRSQKSRADVSHSTKKPWKQKGTGRARAGMSSSPLWRGGGKIFPATPQENFAKKVNRKMYRSAMSCIYSELLRQSRLFLVDEFQLSSPKTKDFLRVLTDMGFNQNVLIVTTGYDEYMNLSSRNLINCYVVDFLLIDPVTLVNSKKVLVTRSAVEAIQEYLS